MAARRRRRVSLALSAALVAAVAGGAGGCSPAAERREIVDRTRLRINLPGPPNTLDPVQATSSSSRFLVHQTFRRLLRRDAAQELRPDLGVVVRRDPRTLRIDLSTRTGTPSTGLDAHDVRASWLRVLRYGPDDHAALLSFIEGADLVRAHRAARTGDAPARLRRAPFLRAEGAGDGDAFGLVPAGSRVNLVESNLCTPRSSRPVMLLEEPRTGSVAVTTLPPGAAALVLTERTGDMTTPPQLWRQVRPLGRARTGWVRARDIESVFTSPRRMVIDAGAQDTVSLFRDPALTDELGDPMTDGDVVELLEQEGAHILLRHERSERVGYASPDVVDDTGADRVWYRINVAVPDRGTMTGWLPARHLVPDDERFAVVVDGPRELTVRLQGDAAPLDNLAHTALSIVQSDVLRERGRGALSPGGPGLSSGAYRLETVSSFDGIRLIPRGDGLEVDVSTLRDPATIFRAFLAGRVSLAWGSEYPDVMLAPLAGRTDVRRGSAEGWLRMSSPTLPAPTVEALRCAVHWPDVAHLLFRRTAAVLPDAAGRCPPPGNATVFGPEEELTICFEQRRAALGAFVGQSLARRGVPVRYRRLAGRTTGCSLVLERSDAVSDDDAVLAMLSLTLVGGELEGVPLDPTTPFGLDKLRFADVLP